MARDGTGGPPLAVLFASSGKEVYPSSSIALR